GLVLEGDRGVDGRGVARFAQPLLGQLGHLAARFARSNGHRADELIIPSGLEGSLLKAAVVLKLAVELGSPVKIGLSEGYAALADRQDSKVASGLDGAGAVEKNLHGDGSLLAVAKAGWVLPAPIRPLLLGRGQPSTRHIYYMLVLARSSRTVLEKSPNSLTVPSMISTLSFTEHVSVRFSGLRGVH